MHDFKKNRTSIGGHHIQGSLAPFVTPSSATQQPLTQLSQHATFRYTGNSMTNRYVHDYATVAITYVPRLAGYHHYFFIQYIYLWQLQPAWPRYRIYLMNMH